MSDPKNGFRMAYTGGKYDVLFNNNSIGTITPNPSVENEWVFTADWDGSYFTADTLSEAKKKAKQALKAAFKRASIAKNR